MKAKLAIKYLQSKLDKLRLFKYNFERIKLYQIALGICLGILLASSQSIFIALVILIVAFPLKFKKLVFYLGLIFGLLYFQSWNYGMDLEVDNTESKLEGFGEIISLEKGELTNSIVIKADSLKGHIISEIGAYSSIELYDRVKLKGTISRPKSFSDFDYPAYLRSNKIFYEFKGAIILDTKVANTLTGLRDLKYSLVKISNSNLSLPYSSLLNGILLGDTSQITKELKDDFRLTGTSHILSVSGFNFTIILIFLLSFSSLFGRRKLLLFSIPLIIGFLFLVGINNVTALRATLMLLVYIVANLLGRKLNYLYLVTITLAIFLLEYPLSWTNLSLQLSFGSLLGLFFLSNNFSSFFKKLPKILAETLSATLAAILGTLPFTIISFGNISLIAPLVNILILPLIPFIMLIGFIGEVFGLIEIKEIAKLFLINAELLLKIVTEVIYKFADIPFANTSDTRVILIAILLLLSIILFSDFKRFYKKYY